MMTLRGLFRRRSGLRPEKCVRRSSLERLEDRIAPANLTVTVSGHTLKIVGDADPNTITINGDVADLTKFIVTTAGETINGSGTSFSTDPGITDISIKLLDGADTVTFATSPGVNVQKSVTIDGGSGGNTISATNLRVGKHLSITNGAGLDTTNLDNLNVGGNVTIKNGDGGSSVQIEPVTAGGSCSIHGNLSLANGIGADGLFLSNTNVGGSVTVKNGDGGSGVLIQRSVAGLSSINGNLSVTNGTGADNFTLNDTNVGGSVTVKNGHGSGAGVAGRSQIFNSFNTARCSIIRGNVSISYMDGSGSASDFISDTEVGGNVSLNFGNGNFIASFESASTSLPTLVDGNFTIKTAGQLTLSTGSSTHRGLTVLKNFSITTGAASDNITLNLLQVTGTTKLALGNGDNVVKIDDSIFGGKFNITAGDGADRLNVETTAGTSLATTFQNAVTGNLGAGNETFAFGGLADSGQFLVLWRDAVFHTGQGLSTSTTYGDHISAPFGSRLAIVQ